jgi:hypothetical protein
VVPGPEQAAQPPAQCRRAGAWAASQPAEVPGPEQAAQPLAQCRRAGAWAASRATRAPDRGRERLQVMRGVRRGSAGRTLELQVADAQRWAQARLANAVPAARGRARGRARWAPGQAPTDRYRCPRPRTVVRPDVPFARACPGAPPPGDAGEARRRARQGTLAKSPGHCRMLAARKRRRAGPTEEAHREKRETMRRERAWVACPGPPQGPSRQAWAPKPPEHRESAPTWARLPAPASAALLAPRSRGLAPPRPRDHGDRRPRRARHRDR